MTELTTYTNPLTTRYASKEMQNIFSNNYKYILWRKLWLSLAIAEQKAGLNITNEQLKAMQDNLTNIDYKTVHKYEQETKHEVMAHIMAFADVANVAKPIIHLGETSAFVIDNADIIIFNDALNLLNKRLVNVMNSLKIFCEKYKSICCLSYTHLQPAQPTTVGKRASIWLHSILLDFNNINNIKNSLKLRGVKGATGTAASFKSLLNNNYQSYTLIDKFVCEYFNFSDSYKVVSQTYDRKIDVQISATLEQIAISSHKITNDLRLLQHLKEVSESFKNNQVGSSAMPYKQNPMLSERISSLSKFVISLSQSLSLVASTQWLERTLDDSANKRLSLPQMFLACDSILSSMHNLFENITVNEKIIAKNLKNELPFMLTENILMLYVQKGGDRQKGHEIIKEISIKAHNLISNGALNNPMIDLILQDKRLNILDQDLNLLFNNSNLIGFSVEQVDSFLLNDINPILEQNKKLFENFKENIV